MSSRNPAAAQKGFTLVEVMVALLVISIGLLGIAKMQALALSSTGTARMRSVAALEAASVAAMMHANRAYWSAITGSTETVTVTVSNSTFSSSDSTVAPPSGGAGCPTTASTPCTPVQVAGQDLTYWTGDLAATMPPNTTATITCPVGTATTPVTCTVKISWTENLVDINTGMNTALTAQQNASALQTNTGATHFLLYVEP